MGSNFLQCSRSVLDVIATSMQVRWSLSMRESHVGHYIQRKTTPLTTAATKPSKLVDMVLIVAGDLANRIASSYPLISLGCKIFPDLKLLGVGVADFGGGV